MIPVNWVFVALISMLSPSEQTPLTTEWSQGSPSEKVQEKNDELLSSREEAQWGAWEQEWQEEEAKTEEEILIEWLPVSNSQMPYKEEF